ncbi:MAG: hypothetical protein KF906_11770 [Actinobacteria bacterium]|nr:hypothetical protein [Actinomycetota bacterium]
MPMSVPDRSDVDVDVDLDADVHVDDLVFNVVWTGTVFSALHRFTDSILAHEKVRLRFLANACPPEEVTAMEAYATARPGSVVDVRVVSTDRMLRHGDCLDLVVREQDDGALFGLLDPDILATGPFIDRFLDLLRGRAAVTSGVELWSADNVRPADNIGVSGEFFYDQDGFVFGSPHLAIYRREPLLATMDRWGVGFSTAGNDIADTTRRRLEELGRSFWIYDTGKVVNILLQGDGYGLVHEDLDALVHVGGLAHFLAPPQPTVGEDGSLQREWGQHDRWDIWEGQGPRFLIAGQAARFLRAQSRGKPLPPPPDGLTPFLADRVHRLRTALATLPPPSPEDGPVGG